MNKEFSRLFKLGDSESVAAMYAEDGKLMVPGSSPGIGRDGKNLSNRRANSY